MVILILLFLKEHFICVTATDFSLILVCEVALQRGSRLLGFDIVVHLIFNEPVPVSVLIVI